MAKKGISRAWGGYNQLELHEGKEWCFYIPYREQPLVKYSTKNITGIPVSTNTNISLEKNSGTFTTDLEVKAV